MGDKSKIEWIAGDDGTLGATWNSLRGTVGRWHCVKVSEGCRRCYAERLNLRFSGIPYRAGADTIRLDQRILEQPQHWRRSRKIFVCSMTDLFGEHVGVDMIQSVFDVMTSSVAKHHTFMVLTKRARRMAQILPHLRFPGGTKWQDRPSPNVWIGVSVENQKTADERIPLLLDMPATIRWVSYEPALGPVDFERWPCRGCNHPGNIVMAWNPNGRCCICDGKRFEWPDWIVVGGESGSGARSFDLAWARSTIRACKTAGVPVFVKQLGACAIDEPNGIAGASLKVPDEAIALVSHRLRHRKGSDPAEWPEGLRVREWPKVVLPEDDVVQMAPVSRRDIV